MPRLNRDALRLVTIAQALSRSGSRVEDVYWENQLAEVIPRLLRHNQDGPLETALDYLIENDLGTYEALLEQIETLSESMVMEKDGERYDVLLVVAPVVAWTRYTIPACPLPAAVQEALVARLHDHILATNARVALMPWLVSVDLMPRTFSETWHWLQRLGAQAIGGENLNSAHNADVEMANMLADVRYIIAAVAAPQGAALYRWQERPDDEDASRAACLKHWAAQVQPTLAALLPGCGLECLLPDAYYVSNREAERRVRPLSLRAAISWLEGAVNLQPAQLRAVVAACGETHVDEYRIGFTARNSNEVFYGCVWPLYGREEQMPADKGQPDVVDDIAAVLKEYGVHDVRRIPGLLAPEHCEDCGAPYFPNPLCELVHAELPEDAESGPPQFH